MVRSLLPLVASLAATFITATASLELYGVNYNTRNGPDWAPDRCKSDADIDADLAVLASVTKRIRIYSLVDCNQGASVLAAAKRHGLQVDLGLWVSKNESVFQAEKETFLNLVTTTDLVNTDLVTGIHVGSEAIYRHDVTAAQNIDYMKQIKKITTDRALGINVTIADIGDVYAANHELVEAVDFVSANGFPFWEARPVVGAAAYFQSRMHDLMDTATALNKPFLISETGWASDGVNVNASIASPGNAAQYLREFLALAVEHQWKYYYFEAFDEPWKIALDANNTVEGHFGLFFANRTLKWNLGSQESAKLPTDGASPSDNTDASAPTPTPPVPAPHPDCSAY